MFQFIIKWLLYLVGTLYILVEKFRQYPNEEKDNILGVKVDEDLQEMSRHELCDFMDEYLPREGFWELNSTTKIRMGAQLLRNVGKENVQDAVGRQTFDAVCDALSNRQRSVGVAVGAFRVDVAEQHLGHGHSHADKRGC